MNCKKSFFKKMFGIKRNCKKEALSDEEIKKIVYSDTSEQYEIFDKVKSFAIDWAKENNVSLIEILFVPLHEFPSEIHSFYKNKSDVYDYSISGVSKKIEEIFQNALTESDFFDKHNERVAFYFDSEENIKEKYKGDFYLYLRA